MKKPSENYCWKVSASEWFWMELREHWWFKSAMITGPYREPLFRVDLDHALEQRLAVRWDKMGHVKHPALHLLQELTQIVMVKRKSALREQQVRGERQTLMTKTWENDSRMEELRHLRFYFKWSNYIEGTGLKDSPPGEQRGWLHNSTRLLSGHHISLPYERKKPKQIR